MSSRPAEPRQTSGSFLTAGFEAWHNPPVAPVAAYRGPVGLLMFAILTACLLTVFSALAPAAIAASTGPSGLPLPRFVSLRAGEVNVRTGPGVRYPIAWVFVRKGLPVEVTVEFELWRKIADIDGTEGWVHRSMLSGERTAIITGGVRTLYQRPENAAMPVLQAEPGVQGRLLSCEASWCELRIEGIRGWTRRQYLWGIYPDEVVP